jgi:hypothetical protein
MCNMEGVRGFRNRGTGLDKIQWFQCRIANVVDDLIPSQNLVHTCLWELGVPFRDRKGSGEWSFGGVETS